MADHQSMVLTAAQVAALKKSKQEKEAHCEIEPSIRASGLSGCPSLLRGQNQRGRLHLPADFHQHRSQVVFVKLYDRKNTLVIADLLPDRMLPFFERQEVPLLRILTYRGTEYCGSLQNHEYELYLAIENIDHTRTKAHHPQTNGICEHFHRTIQDE